MRTSLSLPRPARRTKKKKLPQVQCEAALRACEIAAASIKCAGDDLAARWVALARELSAGAGPTDLLRTRAWCNVLELRLKERAHALAEARALLDHAWQSILAQPTTPSPAQDLPTSHTQPHWPFLSTPELTVARPSRRS